MPTKATIITDEACIRKKLKYRNVSSISWRRRDRKNEYYRIRTLGRKDKLKTRVKFRGNKTCLSHEETEKWRIRLL
jgi:hypothetical protein